MGILERTVICHWSFVIGEKNNIQKPPLIGRGCQPPVPLDPLQKLLIKGGHSLQPEKTFMQTMAAFGSFKVRRFLNRSPMPWG